MTRGAIIQTEKRYKHCSQLFQIRSREWCLGKRPSADRKPFKLIFFILKTTFQKYVEKQFHAPSRSTDPRTGKAWHRTSKMCCDKKLVTVFKNI